MELEAQLLFLRAAKCFQFTSRKRFIEVVSNINFRDINVHYFSFKQNPTKYNKWQNVRCSHFYIQAVFAIGFYQTEVYNILDGQTFRRVCFPTKNFIINESHLKLTTVCKYQYLYNLEEKPGTSFVFTKLKRRVSKCV